ncbi:MAG: M28 family peptidase [Ignavibacteriales bacterium]|nr:M28 family peptidase [Ignavibacteriales bacterium]
MIHRRTALAYILLIFIAISLNAGQTDTALVRKMLNAVSESNLVGHISAMGNAGGYFNRVSFTPGNTVAVRYLDSVLSAQSRLTVANDTFSVAAYPPPYNNMPAVNILGTLRGSVFPDTYAMMCAHLDCSASRMGDSVWMNTWRTIRTLGADDNASGIAAVLECARIMSDSSLRYSPDYSIIFAAWGDEEGIPPQAGLMGSTHYANEARARGMKIAGVVNVDMIAYNPQKIYADIFSNPLSVWMGDAAVAVNNRYGLRIPTNASPYVNAGYSDHLSFWNAGYPAIMIIEHAFPWTSDINYTSSPHYHRSSDTLGTLNIPMAKALTQLALGTLTLIAQSSSATSIAAASVHPEGFFLDQNYPNPFNPETQFRFTLEHATHVRLSVHDVLGRQISLIVDGGREAGPQAVSWNAAAFPSGVYFYTMTAGRSSATRKLVIQK